jgi:hypothetical protein
MTKDDYQKAIPLCCSHKTADEHAEVMLYCWGITAGFVQTQGESYCEGCSENINYINQGDSK